MPTIYKNTFGTHGQTDDEDGQTAEPFDAVALVSTGQYRYVDRP